MQYDEALNYISEIQKRGSVLGLDAIRSLLDHLGNPQDQLKVIHVAGTNGKGSICTFLEVMYRAEGKRVGRYISPTLDSYLERFQINGSYMERDEFAGYITDVATIIHKMEKENDPIPTAFEIETAIAFLFFVRQKADIVILETGMGGREDATNVVKHPLCTVFASIGMDHMQFLGDTIEEIAYEKAGILKDGCPAVTYPNPSTVLHVLEQEADRHKAELTKVDPDAIEILSETLRGTRFRYKEKIYSIRMPGTYQVYNAATAIETKLLLDGTVKEGSLLQAEWAGRFEVMSESPLLIRDGAHNVDGALALKECIQKHFTNQNLIFIIGVLRDKEYEKMVRILCPMAEQIYTITPDNERGLPAEKLKESILPYCQNVTVCASVKEAVRLAGVRAECESAQGAETVIVAWGSLSYLGLVGEALKTMEKDKYMETSVDMRE